MEISENIIRERLSKFDCRTAGFYPEIPEGFVKASVLIPLFFKDGSWKVILTVRSKKLRSHPGLVAFPGGHEDESDPDIVHTALREAEEEIGIPPENVNIVSVLSPTFVRPNKLVYSCVGIVTRGFEPNINTEEVYKVFELPIERFLREDYRQSYINVGETLYSVYFFTDEVDGKDIVTWGFTANVCMLLAIVIFDSDKIIQTHHDRFLDKSNAFEISGFKEIVEKLSKHASKM